MDTSKVTFKHNGRVLCKYSPFIDIAELEETIGLLAYEHGINENEIIAELETIQVEG